MSLTLVRNNLGILRCFSPYRSLRNLCALTETRKLAPLNSGVLIARRIIRPNVNLIRKVSTIISIQEYKSNRKYTTFWIAERCAGISLIFLIPMIFAVESQELEMALAVVGSLHTYWGCQSMCNDYVRSAVVGRFLPVAARLLNISLSLATLAGFYRLIYEDCGIANMIKKFWAIRGQDVLAPPKEE